MITLTQTAASKLQGIMTERGLNDYALRVFINGGGCCGLSYGMAFANEFETDDQIFESAGVKVVIDGGSFPYLEGTNIDYIDTPKGSGFRIENPNTVGGSCSSDKKQSCGCN